MSWEWGRYGGFDFEAAEEEDPDTLSLSLGPDLPRVVTDGEDFRVELPKGWRVAKERTWTQ